MAKTILNEKVDAFFKKYSKSPITKEIVISSNLDIKESNDYGNLLHAIVNYKYPENRVLELITILMDMGIDVNKRGKTTGLSFIHLSLYGYTDHNNVDFSYSEEFIIKLINLAIEHGLDPNIKDDDSETIAEAAIASEVYTGKIIPIIKALGPSFEVSESLEKKFNHYLKNSNGQWQKRLKLEESALKTFIKRSQFNPETFKKELDKSLNKVNSCTQNIDYASLKENYIVIAESINELKELLVKALDFEMDIVFYQNTMDQVLTNEIISILEREIDIIEKNPSDSSIKNIKEIILAFAFQELLKRIEIIATNYQDYKDELIASAKRVKTIAEGKSFKQGLNNNEISEELASIIDKKMSSLRGLISSIKEIIEEKEQMKEQIDKYIEVDIKENNYMFETMTQEQLDDILNQEQNEKEKLHQSIMDYIISEYEKLKISLMPLIESEIVTNEEIESCFKGIRKIPKSKRKKNQNETR